MIHMDYTWVSQTHFWTNGFPRTCDFYIADKVCKMYLKKTIILV